METFPKETCVFCDLPWKNNRVCYGGELCPPPAVRALDLGGTHVTLSEAGEILGTGGVRRGAVPVRDGSSARRTERWPLTRCTACSTSRRTGG